MDDKIAWQTRNISNKKDPQKKHRHGMVSENTYTFKSSLLSHILVALTNIKINANLEKTQSNA